LQNMFLYSFLKNMGRKSKVVESAVDIEVDNSENLTVDEILPEAHPVEPETVESNVESVMDKKTPKGKKPRKIATPKAPRKPKRVEPVEEEEEEFDEPEYEEPKSIPDKTPRLKPVKLKAPKAFNLGSPKKKVKDTPPKKRRNFYSKIEEEEEERLYKKFKEEQKRKEIDQAVEDYLKREQILQEQHNQRNTNYEKHEAEPEPIDATTLLANMIFPR